MLSVVVPHDHRIVFTRVRIDDEFHIKITDCALSRDLFPMDYHCLGDNENKPVKWMAVESLEQHRFTTASDVVCIHFIVCTFRMNEKLILSVVVCRTFTIL